MTKRIHIHVTPQPQGDPQRHARRCLSSALALHKVQPEERPKPNWGWGEWMTMIYWASYACAWEESLWVAQTHRNQHHPPGETTRTGRGGEGIRKGLARRLCKEKLPWCKGSKCKENHKHGVALLPVWRGLCTSGSKAKAKWSSSLGCCPQQRDAVGPLPSPGPTVRIYKAMHTSNP